MSAICKTLPLRKADRGKGVKLQTNAFGILEQVNFPMKQKFAFASTACWFIFFVAMKEGAVIAGKQI
jgi:hypothetical protein